MLSHTRCTDQLSWLPAFPDAIPGPTPQYIYGTSEAKAILPHPKPVKVRHRVIVRTPHLEPRPVLYKSLEYSPAITRWGLSNIHTSNDQMTPVGAICPQAFSIIWGYICH